MRLPPGFWLRMLVEGVLILLSVLLALGLNAWYADRQQERLARVVLDRVDTELEANARMVAWRLPYHRTIRDSTQELIQRRIRPRPDGSLRFEGSVRGRDLGIRDGVGLATAGRFADDAWRVLNTDAVLPEIPTDLLFVLARTYGTQQELVETQRSLLGMMDGLAVAAFGEASPGPPVLTFSATVVDLVLREEELHVLYAEADSLLALELDR